jgi:hypothetical protein
MRASELLGWQDAATWFRVEINGCSYDSAPSHRLVNATLEYRDSLGEFYASQQGFPKASLLGVTDKRALCEPLKNLARYREVGIHWPTGTTRIRQQRTGLDQQLKNVEEREWVIFPAASIQTVLDRVEQHCFDFAIHSEQLLVFGDLALDIFEQYRESIEQPLTRLGIDESLSAIESNVRAGTAETSKLAVLGCRNVMIGLSNKLWKVPGLNAHPTLQNHKGKPLQLDHLNVKARLRAYLYERGVSVSTPQGPTLISIQLELIADTVDQLYNVASEQGKNHVAQDDARALVLQTFFLIGEMARLTGLVPVTSLAISAASP